MIKTQAEMSQHERRRLKEKTELLRRLESIQTESCREDALCRAVDIQTEVLKRIIERVYQ